MPDVGDLVSLALERATAGKRVRRQMALVLTPRRYNLKTRVVVACPIATSGTGYPFDVQLPARGKISGMVVADRVRALNWQQDQVTFEAKAPANVVAEVRERLRALLGL